MLSLKVNLSTSARLHMLGTTGDCELSTAMCFSPEIQGLYKRCYEPPELTLTLCSASEKYHFPPSPPSAVSPQAVQQQRPTKSLNWMLRVEQPVKTTSSLMNPTPGVSPSAPARQEILPHHGLACCSKTSAPHYVFFRRLSTKNSPQLSHKGKKKRKKEKNH